MTLDVRTTFGHAAVSLEGVRQSVGASRPVSLQQLADLYNRDVVFDEPIVTDEPLGGRHTLTVRRDGSYRYQGHFRATGFPSFDVAIVTTLGYPIPVPGSPTPAGAQVAFAAKGRVHGSNEDGDRVYSWDRSGKLPILAAEWDGVRQSRLNRRVEYDTDWFGSAGGIASFLGQVAIFGATFGAAGVAIVLAGEAADHLNLEQLVIPGTVGLMLSAGAAYVLGPGLMIPAFLVGTAVTAAAIKQEHLSDDEKAFADQVFRGKVPFDRVLKTNLVGFGGRPFTAPGPGGAIIMNLGKGYDDPIHYTGKGGDKLGVNAAGQLFIHELTHAWQIANESFTPGFYCRAASTAVGTVDGDMSAYSYGAAGDAWGAYGTEQQASIVDSWFAGSDDPDAGNPQGIYPPMYSDDQGANQNPYYRYIRDNIRTGIA